MKTSKTSISDASMLEWLKQKVYISQDTE